MERYNRTVPRVLGKGSRHRNGSRREDPWPHRALLCLEVSCLMLFVPRQARSRAIAPMAALWCLAWMIRCVGKQCHACRPSDLALVGQGCRANDLASAGHAHPCVTLPRLARSSASQPASQPASTPALRFANHLDGLGIARSRPSADIPS